MVVSDTPVDTEQAETEERDHDTMTEPTEVTSFE